jgi:hypothetical protein
VPLSVVEAEVVSRVEPVRNTAESVVEAITPGELDALVAWQAQQTEPGNESDKDNHVEVARTPMIEQLAVAGASVGPERPRRFSDPVEKVFVLADEAIPSETIAGELEPGPVPILKADDLEIPAAIEAYQARDYEYYELEVEAETHEAVEDDLSLLVAEPSEDIPAPVEYTEHLEIVTPTEYGEAGILEEYDEPWHPGPVMIAAKEPSESHDNTPETSTIRALESVVLRLEALEPAQVEAVSDIITTLSISVQESQQMLAEASDEEKEAIERDLTVACAQLFECLGIDYDDEIIKQFMEAIGTFEPSADSGTDPDMLSVEALNRMGTYEYKPVRGSSLLSGLARFVKERMQPSLMMGRFALQACSA